MVLLRTEYEGQAALPQKLVEIQRNLCNLGWYSVPVVSQYFTHSIFLITIICTVYLLMKYRDDPFEVLPQIFSLLLAKSHEWSRDKYRWPHNFHPETFYKHSIMSTVTYR